MRLGFISACTLLLAASSGVLADTTIGSTATAGASQSAGHSFFGQSFVAPAGETVLGSATLVAWSGIDRFGTLEVWGFSDDGSTGTLLAPVGSALFALPAGNEQLVSATFNVAVTPGDKYAVLVNWNGPQNTAGGYFGSNYYAGGSTFFESQGSPVMFTGFDQAFSVSFGLVPEPACVAFVGAVGAMALRRRAK